MGKLISNRHLAVMLVLWILQMGLIAGIMAIAVHFISKYW